MRRCPLTAVALWLIAGQPFLSAQTVVNSTWLGGDFKYSNPANWSPAEVPNNSATKIYNVTAPLHLSADIDATVANLTLAAGIYLERSYTVTGTTTLHSTLWLNSFSPGGVIFKTSSLSTLSNGVLTGSYLLEQQHPTDGPALLQLNGASVIKLSNAQLSLAGPFTGFIDEFGTNALNNLAEIDSSSRLGISGQQLVTGAPQFRNDGILSIFGDSAFIITGTFINFDNSTKTLAGGSYEIGGGGTLRFSGADIVNNAAAISLAGPGGLILDTAGGDAFRNFAHNLPAGSLSVESRDFAIDNDFTNDGALSARNGSITISGALTNYNAQSKRLSGGVYKALSSGTAPGRLTVAGADIVHNSAVLQLDRQSSFTDENGNNALRNLVDNEAGGSLSLTVASFQAPSDFTNAGVVWLFETEFKIPAGHIYRQTGGRTTITASPITSDAEILGGQLSGRWTELSRFDPRGGPGIIDGNLFVGNALLDPNPLTVTGSVQLSDTTRFRKIVGVAGVVTDIGLTVNASLALAGTLEIETPPAYSTSADSVFHVAHADILTGTFSNAANGARIRTRDGFGSFVVTYTNTDVTITDFQRLPAGHPLNIATRAQVLTGDNPAIGGFIVTGVDPKKVLIRAIGPSLVDAGVSDALEDPLMELRDSKGAIVTVNDNWQDTQSSEITGAGIPPTDPRESAMVETLLPGAYTAVVRGKSDTIGVALVEIYDLSSGSPSKLGNISTRGFVDADHVLIGGLIAGGNGEAKTQVVVRAIGRSLGFSGVQNFLPDAALEVRDQDGALLAANDDFLPADDSTGVPQALWPSSDTDAAIAITVAPGNYTAVVHGKNGASGNALVEIYDLNQ
jgi:hypothetical protein